MTTVLHILHSVLARPAIYIVHKTTGSFAFTAKTLLRATNGGGGLLLGEEAGFGNTFVFSPTVSPICGAVNLGNQSWGNTSKHIYENFGFGVSGGGMWRFSGWNYGCKCIHHPGGPEAWPPPE